MRNVIVTGIPRSGTSLTAALIDSLPNCVCLNEPEWQWKRAESPRAYAAWLAEDFCQLRTRLLSGEGVLDRRTPAGQATTNFYPERPQEAAKHHVTAFTRPGLSAEFTLAVKHNLPYLTYLQEIIALKGFTVLAVLRNPVDVIYSWRSVKELPLNNGTLFYAKNGWPKMDALVHTPMDLLEKQVRLYDLMAERLHHFRAHIHILTYEAILQDPATLCRSLKLNGTPDKRLIDQASARRPDEVQKRDILQALQRYGSHYRHFYPDV